MIEMYFDLFACCIPVLGHTRATICDIQRNTYIILPRSIVEVLVENRQNKHSIKSLLSLYGDDLLAWFEKLHSEEYGHFFNDIGIYDSLPEIDLKLHEYNHISNSIIDFDELSEHDLQKISTDLSHLFCEAVELRYYFAPSLERLSNDMSYFQDSTIRTIEVIVANNSQFRIADYKKLIRGCKRLHRMTIHSSMIKKQWILEDEKVLRFISTELTDSSHCGVIDPYFFSINISTIKDNTNVNSCLYKKISVDVKGNIKNCPSSHEVLGHVQTHSLLDIMDHPKLKDLWYVKKDMITVCKDCEFRLICIDCRINVENSNDIFSKPKNCKYDPYEAKYIL